MIIIFEDRFFNYKKKEKDMVLFFRVEAFVVVVYIVL